MQKRSATLLILMGGTCMSFAGLFIRLVHEADGFQILAYRSIGIMIVVALVTSMRRRISPWAFIRSIDRDEIVIGFVLALAFITYVFSMLMTSVASTLFILTAAPFMTALIGRLVLDERPSPVIWMSMIGAFIGVGIMIGDGFDAGKTTGNILAIISAFLFALMLVMARKTRKHDVLGATFMGGAFSSIIGFAVASTIGGGILISLPDLVITLSMGLFTIGLGIALVFWGTPHVPAAEVSLLVLIESVLGPVWVWVFLSERMTVPEIIGGALVICSVAVSVLVGKSPRTRHK